MARGSETQSQVVENFNELSNELYNYIVLAAQRLIWTIFIVLAAQGLLSHICC